MSKDLFKPMTAQDFLDVALPGDVCDERRSSILRHHGRGESGTNFFSPSTNSFITAIKSDKGISLRFQTRDPQGQVGSHSVELFAAFETPPQNDMPLPQVRLAYSRVFSGHEVAPTDMYMFRVPRKSRAGLTQTFRKWLGANEQEQAGDPPLTRGRLKATLSIFQHAYRSMSLNLEPRVPDDHPVFSATAEPDNPPLKMHSVTAAGMAAIKHRKPST